jgi:hypothetical protein
MKIVINSCYGGFGLSHEGVMHYAKLKGLTLYLEKGDFGLTEYWTVPKDHRPVKPDFNTAPIAERMGYNRKYKECTLWDNYIDRDDPDLVRTVEELGNKANGHYAKLNIAEIPDGIEWEIEEYDGMEHVAEKHRTWA